IPPSLKAVFSYSNFVHALSGAVGSVTAMTVFYPLDTARTRLQVDDKRKAKGTFLVMKEIVDEEGILSLYRGLIPVLTSLYCSNFLFFYTFNCLKAVFLKNKHVSSKRQDLLFGYIAGIVNVLLTTPLWVANTRLKLQGANRIVTSLLPVDYQKSCSLGKKKKKRKKKIKHARSFHNTHLFLFFTHQKLSAWEFFIIGAIAKAVATVVTYPLQVAQCKQRVSRYIPITSSPMLSSTGFVTMRQARMKAWQGGLGLYKGLEAKLLQTVLTAALMFLAYEKIAAVTFSISRRIRR
ncbi:predicted protein, partial [Nematostella vectensis]